MLRCRFADRERRVAQPEAELVQRVARREVAVARVVLRRHVARAAGRLVVVVDRHLADRARERDRQLAAGVDLAEQHVGDRVAGLDAREPGLEDRRRRTASTSLSVSGRPLNSTTTNGLPVALIASISSCCLPGRSMSLRAAASPLMPAALAEREHDLVGARSPRRPRPRSRASEPHSSAGCCPAGRCRGSSQPWRERRVRVLRLDAGEHATRRRRRRPCPTRGRACRARRRRAGRSRRSSWSGRAAASPPSFFSSTIDLPAAARAAARSAGVTKLVGSTALAWSTYGWSNSPARNLTRRIRRTASSMRDIEMRSLRQQLLAVVADVGADHLRVGAGVERGARGVGAVGGDAVAARALVRGLRRAGAQLGDGGVVALDEAVEAPLALQDVGLECRGSRSRGRR